MNVLIVHAHPEPKSFNTALRDHSVRALGGLGHAVQVSDLYAMNFNPVAGPGDFTDRADPDYLVYALEQRHGFETGTLAPDIQAEIETLMWCDLLILHFPLYWFSVPAILKGWIDRVLVSGLTVLPPFVAWHVPYVDDATRAGYLDDYAECLGNLDNLTPLAFPSLDDFDAAMRPK